MDRPQHSRSKSGISFKSNKSDKSTESSRTKPLVRDLHESEAERRKSKFEFNRNTNPNRAISEAQPAVRQLEAYTLAPIRSMQHRDSTGNVITDPDSSNPSRHRMERPLDTIRSFEAAIDTGYSQRTRSMRGDGSEAPTGYSSRRSSFVGGNEGPVAPRYSTNAAHGNSPRVPSSYRHASYDNNYPGNPYPHGQRRPYGQRYASAPGPSKLNYEQAVYHSHGYQESHDTVHTGGSSGSASEPWTNSTDPSSENSSIDRLQASKQMDTGDAYGGVYGAASSAGHGQQPYIGNGYSNGYGGNYGNGGGHPSSNGHVNGGGYPPPNGYSNGSPVHDTIMEEQWQDGRGYYHQPYGEKPQPPHHDRQPVYNERPQYSQSNPYDRPFAAKSNAANAERPPPPPSQMQPSPTRNVIKLTEERQPMPQPMPNVQKWPSNPSNNLQNGPAPPGGMPPRRQTGTLRKGPSSKPLPVPPKQPEKEKRKSWLKRTFSKS